MILEFNSSKDLPVRHIIPNGESDLRVEVADGVNVVLVEAFAEDPAQSINYSHHLIAGKNSEVLVVTIQNLNAESTYSETRTSEIHESAKVRWLNIQLGAKLAQGTMHHHVVGSQAQADMDLICKADDQRSIQFTLTNRFTAPHSAGQMIAKGAASGSAKLGMHGCIQIDQSASGTDGYLRQDTLLLSEKASASAMPSLKIDTNDVKAAHSASVANVDESALFYMASRGLPKDDARQLLVQGFKRITWAFG
ncbi:SufD family Fe-S cluster assembly protein [Candidatus Peregrinibacteria bacterium]|nr:MAG: SufD family Fe-S cluster assembly protein [Candidatus Peregrinibacteria bacterium]